MIGGMRQPRRVATCLLLGSLASAQIPLRYDLATSQPFHYGITIDATFAQTRGAQRAEFGMHFALHFTATPGETKDGKTQVAHLLHRVQARSTMPMAKVDWDSDRKDSQPGALQSLAELVGKTFIVPVDEYGAIGRVQAPTGVTAKATDDLGAGDLDTLFGQYFIALPNTPIAEGGSWDAAVKMFNPKLTGGGDVKVTSKLVRVAEGKAVVERKFHVDPASAPKAPGMTVTVDKAESTWMLDLSTGRVSGSVMELASTVAREGQQIASSVRVTVNPEAAPGPKTGTATPVPASAGR